MTQMTQISGFWFLNGPASRRERRSSRWGDDAMTQTMTLDDASQWRCVIRNPLIRYDK